MFCSSCGAENKDTAKFCGKCGGKMAVEAMSPETPPAAFASQTAPSSAAPMSTESVNTTPVPAAADNTTTLKIGIVVASLFIPIVGIVMGIIYIRDADSGKKAMGKLWLAVGSGMTVFWVLSGGL